MRAYNVLDRGQRKSHFLIRRDFPSAYTYEVYAAVSTSTAHDFNLNIILRKPRATPHGKVIICKILKFLLFYCENRRYRFFYLYFSCVLSQPYIIFFFISFSLFTGWPSVLYDNTSQLRRRNGHHLVTVSRRHFTTPKRTDATRSYRTAAAT